MVISDLLFTYLCEPPLGENIPILPIDPLLALDSWGRDASLLVCALLAHAALQGSVLWPSQAAMARHWPFQAVDPAWA